MPFMKIPGYPLNTVIEALWFCKAEDFYSKVTTFPLLNEGLFIDFSESYKSYNTSGKIIGDNKKIWFAGIHSKPFLTEVKGNHEQYGILFKPGGIYKLFGVPATELAENFIDADDVFRNEFNEMMDTVVNDKTPLSKLNFIEKFLTKKLSDRKINSYLENIVSEIDSDNLRNGGIKKLLSEINQSSKSFIANFKKVYGLTPKKFCRMKLINNSLNEIIAKPNSSLTQVALNNGFYDQSHFIRHFNFFLNISPKEYKRYAVEGNVSKEFPNFLEHKR